LTRRADISEEMARAVALLGLVEHGQAAVIQGMVKLALFRSDQVLSFEGGSNEIAGGRRQIGDVADGARTRTAGSAERFAHEIGEVVFAVFPGGLGDLDEHGLQDMPLRPYV